MIFVRFIGFLHCIGLQRDEKRRGEKLRDQKRRGEKRREGVKEVRK